MPGILGIFFIFGVAVLGNAGPDTFKSAEAFKEAVKAEYHAAKPVDYSKLNQ